MERCLMRGISCSKDKCLSCKHNEANKVKAGLKEFRNVYKRKYKELK